MTNRRIKNDVLELLDGEGNIILSVREELRGGTLDVRLEGMLKNEAAHAAGDELSAAVCAGVPVEVDLGGLTYLAGMGIKALLEVLALSEENGSGRMRLVNVPEHFAAVLREAGYSGEIDSVG